MKAMPTKDSNGALCGYMIFCPACECGHLFWTERADHPKWEFNGNCEKPTFSPSMLVRRDYGERHEKQVCHSHVIDGNIQFGADCTHQMAGKTVTLPDIGEDCAKA